MRAGSSPGAALAFWLGNPILNPATMIFMGFVLGWHWVGLRIAAGLLLVLGVAYFAQFLVSPNPSFSESLVHQTVGEDPSASSESIWIRWVKALWQLCAGLIPEYIVLVLVLGAARAWLFPAIGPQATGTLWTVGLALAGTLFVIPTAGEIPIVQTLMQFGLGVGPAAALLTTLPPVSLPSLVMLGKALPARVLLFVGGSVAGLGLASAAAAVLFGF